MRPSLETFCAAKEINQMKRPTEWEKIFPSPKYTREFKTQSTEEANDLTRKGPLDLNTESFQ